MNRTRDILGRFTVLVGTIALVWTVGCDVEPTSSSPSSNKSQPPKSPVPLEPPVRLLRDLAKTPSSRPEDDRAQDIPHGEARSGSTAKRQPKEASQAGSAAAGRGGAPVVSRSGTSPAGTRSQVSAKLSAGVAMPQSLPIGTTMGFSVDYVLQGSLPTSSGHIVWVIESAKHGSAEVAVRLDTKGNLMNFIPGMKPEHGPFQCYLAIVFPDGHKQPISAKVAMRSP